MNRILELQDQISEIREKIAGALENRSVILEKLNALKTRAEEADSEEMISSVETEIDAVQTEKETNDSEHQTLSAKLKELERDLSSEMEAQDIDADESGTAPIENRAAEILRRKTCIMRDRYFGLTLREFTEAIAEDESQAFLSRARAAMLEKRAITGAEAVIPVRLLPLIKEVAYRESKLYDAVTVRRINGPTKQPVEIGGQEGFWVDACADLKELTLSFGAALMQPSKVGGFVVLCKALAEASDIDLAAEIIEAIGSAIAKAIDKAIVAGNNNSMPLGIATRLVQTAAPADADSENPFGWTDLHTSNVIQGRGADNAITFDDILDTAAQIDTKYTDGELTWVMSQKTYGNLLKEIVKYFANDGVAAYSSELQARRMPVVSGRIVILPSDIIADGHILAGAFKGYVLGEDATVEFDSSDQVYWLSSQTAFKGEGRFDGVVAYAPAFVILSNGTSWSVSFAGVTSPVVIEA